MIASIARSTNCCHASKSSGRIGELFALDYDLLLSSVIVSDSRTAHCQAV
jgi:hypothetical protein